MTFSNGQEVHDTISRLGGKNSWDALNDLISQFSHPERKKLAEEDQARRDAENAAFRRDLLEIFNCPAGIRVLNKLVSGTVGRPPINFSMSGLSADQIGVIASYRDGQNTVIHALLTDLKEAGFDPSSKGDDT